jgi:hypothetical protein
LAYITKTELGIKKKKEKKYRKSKVVGMS